ncbi:MAG: hypothetical protein ACREUC_20870, partial [Steroidobacteraceae bacterium]
RNRIDGIVLFQPLRKDEVRAIALKYIGEVEETLQRWNKTLTVEPEALEKLVQEGYSLAYGARFLKRVIDDKVKLPVSQRWKEVNQFRVSVRDDQLVVDPVGPRLIVTSDPDAIAV